MRFVKAIPIILMLFFLPARSVAFAEEEAAQQEEAYALHGQVNGDGINVRTDATSSAEVICKVNNGDDLEIVTERYDWYKIRLPGNAPVFVKEDMVAVKEDKTGIVLKDKVNVRSRPDTTSAILGKLHKDQAVKVVEESGGWLRIEPIKDSFGWIHKNFLSKVEKKMIAKKEENLVNVEGIIKSKVFTRVATHKLICADDKVYLLRGNKEELNSYNNRKVKLIGKIVDPTQIKFPILEVKKIEALP